MEMNNIGIQGLNLTSDLGGKPFHRPVCLLTISIEQQWQHVKVRTKYGQSPGQAGIALIDTGIAAGPCLDEHTGFYTKTLKPLMDPPGCTAGPTFLIECIDVQDSQGT